MEGGWQHYLVDQDWPIDAVLLKDAMKEETTHPSPDAGATQCEAILARLIEARGEWVPMPELCRVSGAYAVHSRIADLRARGHSIPPPRLTRRGRTVLSAYRIEMGS